eukprot:gene14990-16536_t
MNTAKRVVTKYRPRCSAADVKKRLPIFQWLPAYNLRKLQADCVAGVAVGLMIIPQSLAHAIIAGLKPQYGLYTSFAAMFVYMFFGTSKDVSMGSAVITALLTNRYSVTDETHPKIAAALTFSVGIILLIVAICRLGFFIRFLSFPVISGFVSASAIIIATSQLRYLFGLSRSPRMIFLKLKHFFMNIKHTHPADVTMGFICLAFLFMFQHLASRQWKFDATTPRWKKRAATVLRVVGIGRNAVIAILAILVSYAFHATTGNIFNTVGELPPGLPTFRFPLQSVKIDANKTLSVPDMISGFGSGLGVLPLIMVIQIVAAAKALGRKSQYKVDTFQEILALGAGNIFGSFFSSFPVTASFSRTAVSNMSGSKTPITGIVTSLVVILAIQFISPLFRFVPMSSLAAIVIAAVVNLIDHKLARQLWRTNKMDFAIWVITFCGCLYEIEIGIMLGVVLSLAVVLYREFNPRLDVNFDKEAKSVTVSLKGGVWFPGIEAVADKIRLELEKRGSDNVSVVVVDCKHMLEVDYTVVHGINEIIADCLLSNVEVRFDNVQDKKVRKHFRDAGFFKPTTSMLGNDDDDDSEENVNGELIGNGSNELGLEPIVSEKKGSPTARTSKDQSELEHLVAIETGM